MEEEKGVGEEPVRSNVKSSQACECT
jgi:hypothetical protein